MDFEVNVSLPPGWTLLEKRSDGVAAQGKIGLRTFYVICSVSKELDGKEWIHASISNPKVMPEYKEMKFLKAHFIGGDMMAYEIHAPASEHVNIHSKCRHLWSCLDGPVTPDFTHGSGSI